jgi:hypothetical protein
MAEARALRRLSASSVRRIRGEDEGWEEEVEEVFWRFEAGSEEEESTEE